MVFVAEIMFLNMLVKMDVTVFNCIAPSNAPTLIEAKGMGTKVVRLKFIPPSTPNGNITGYKANIFLNDPVYAQVWKEYEIKENRNQMYVGDLPSKSDPTFWFTVAARTSIGYGPFSEPKSAQTLDHDRKY